MSAKTEALKQFFAAINRNDMQAITRDFDPQIVRIEPAGFPAAGTHRGITEMEAHVTNQATAPLRPPIERHAT